MKEILKYGAVFLRYIIATDLSTIIWNGIAKNIIGIEPNDDMRATAKKKNKYGCIVYRKGVSYKTGLPSDYADIITVSQAFHWMDIDSTLPEFYRILKPGGVLAIYDHEWPPIMDWEIEKAYDELMINASKIVYPSQNSLVHNDKNTYHDRIKSFGRFSHSREAACHSVGKCTPQRMVDFPAALGGINEAMKIDTSIKKDIDEFLDLVKVKYDHEFEIIIPYKIVIVVK